MRILVLRTHSCSHWSAGGCRAVVSANVSGGMNGEASIVAWILLRCWAEAAGGSMRNPFGVDGGSGGSVFGDPNAGGARRASGYTRPRKCWRGHWRDRP